jgi:hypothetical protein
VDQENAEVREMFLSVVRSLVDRPEDVEILPVLNQAGVTFRVQAHAADLGKLIGADGRTARALRTIMHANASRRGRSFSLDIGDASPKG